MNTQTLPPFKVFIGYDSREQLAYEVLRHSILRNTTYPVEIIPLKHVELRQKGHFSRPWLTEANTGNRIDLLDGKPFSTEFSHTRFLVPKLADYQGWALFMDCDMLFKCNIKELFALKDDKFAVMCVKHRHEPKAEIKMDGQIQTRYHRKNWSSFVLWNCAHPANRFLTPQAVNTMTGTSLHSFAWLEDFQIGALGPEWNWIEGSSPAVKEPKVVHYTEGGPWFEHMAGLDRLYFDRWEEELAHYRRWGEDILAGKSER